jgi:cysteine desulfurase/selenocysteine lyase
MMITKEASLDVAAVRGEFAILNQEVHGKPLVYLDNAASTQKPRAVTEAVKHFCDHDYSNIHRGVHTLSQRSTELYESVRRKVKLFVNAQHKHEIIFTRGTTEGINLVASSWGRANLNPGDEVLITYMEHHSNIVPWQAICRQTGAILKVAPITDSGELDLEAFSRLLTDKTKLVSVTHVSNALGTINPVKDLVKLGHAVGAKVLIDGAQSAPHLAIDVQDIGADFYAFSGHKVYGPSGIGALYGRSELLKAMPPYQFGGDMIHRVTFEKTTYADLPSKFEAGTPNIEGVIGLGAAIDFVQSIGKTAIRRHEQALTERAMKLLSEIEGVRLIGTAPSKCSVVSFVLDTVHPHDVGTVLDTHGVAIRAGHHCAQPLMDRFGVPATVRASFAIYNTFEEIDALVSAVRKAKELFG